MTTVSLSLRLPKVSRIAVGSLTVSKMQSALPIHEAAGVLAYAFDNGINFVDTAQYYENYDLLREALRLCKSPESIVISTKTYAYSRELAAAAVDEARRELDRDTIDIFMLHEQESIDTLRGHMPALEYLFECRERGIIKAVGASTHHTAAVRGLIELRRAGMPIDVCHPLYNMAGIGIADGSEADMAEAIETAHDCGIGIFAMKALGGGHLCSSAEAALSFVLQKPFIDAVAVGMQSADEVDANIRFMESGSFSEIDRSRLAKKRRRLHVEEYCEGCGACVSRCASGALSLELVPSDSDSASAYDFTGQFISSAMPSDRPYEPKLKYRAAANDEKCVRCGYCTRACKMFALKVY